MRLIDVVGDTPDIRSWLYADAYLRRPERAARLPLAELGFERRRGIWLPLHCTIARVGTPVGASSANSNDVTTGNYDSSNVDLLIASGSAYAGTPAFTDNKSSNVWNTLTEHRYASNGLRHLFAWCIPVSKGSGHTFTNSPGAGNVPSIIVAGYSGTLAGTPFDQQNGAPDGTVTPVSTGAAVPTTANQLVVAGFSFQFLSTISISGGGFSSVLAQQNYSSGLAVGTAFAELIQTTATSSNPAFNGSPDPFIGAASIATFKAAVAGVTVGRLLGMSQAVTRGTVH